MQIDDGTDREPRLGGWAWAVVPLGWVGGAIGYFALRSNDPRRADHVMKWGLIWTVVSVLLWTGGTVGVMAWLYDGGAATSAGTRGAHAVLPTSTAQVGSDKETAPVTVSGTELPQYSASTDDPAIGKTIPTLTGITLDGKPIEITPTGKPQAIVFLAHWCPHCQAEVPRLVALARGGTFGGVDVTGVATGTNSGYPNYPPSSWLQREHWPFPVMADSSSFTAAKAFGLTSYPYFVLVDANGKVVGRASGEVSDADVSANIKALLAGQPLPLTSSGASSSAK